MNADEQLLKNLRKIDTNLNNNLIKTEVLSRDKDFNYEALRGSIKKHINSIDSVGDLESEEYSDLVDNASMLAEVTGKGVGVANINQFFNSAAYFIKERQEKGGDAGFEIKKSTILPTTIDKNEFEARYRRLVELLSDVSSEKSNLTLFTEVEGKRFKLFRQGENLAVQPSTNTPPFTISLKHLLQIAYEGKKTTRSYDTVIIQKIMSGSIFDFIGLDIEQNDEYLANRLDESIKTISEQIKNLQSSEQHIELQKQLSQAKTLFDEAVSSKDKIDKVLEQIKTENTEALAKLDSAKQGEIAYFLSEQFSDKSVGLAKTVNGYKINMFWWILSLIGISLIIFSTYAAEWSRVDFTTTESIIIVLALKLPIIFMVFFNLNEYGKAKKLYEEYENKRIMAATLVNSLHRIREELKIDTKDLIEIIKMPMERIFDNPVHSIYGDKSGDKNSMKDMLDQFDKLSSIMEKMKK